MDIGTTYFIHRFFPPTSGKLRALLILVHGRTGNLKLLEWYSKRFQIEGLGFLTIQAPYPDRRPDQKDEGYSWFLESGEGILQARAHLQSMMHEIHQQGLAYSQIYWLGFSQGAVMGLDHALRADRKLGGFLCISGFCYRPDEYPKSFGPEAKNQRILITHGTRDEIISLERAEKTYEAIRQLGVSFQFKVFDKPHSFHLQQEIPLLERALTDWINSQVGESL